MADFLSDAWFLAVNERLARALQPELSAARSLRTTSNTSMVPLVVAIELSSESQAPTLVYPDVQSWHLRIDAEGARITPGISTDPLPTLTIYTDVATSRELASNTINAQRAIDSGRLRVRGDLNALATLTSVFERLSTMPSHPVDSSSPRDR